MFLLLLLFFFLFLSSNSAWEIKTCLVKNNLKLTLIMSSRYTAHSVWDSSHEQIGRTSGQEKKGKRIISNVKWKTVRSLSVLCVSMCVFILGQCSQRLIGLKRSAYKPNYSKFKKIKLKWISGLYELRNIHLWIDTWYWCLFIDLINIYIVKILLQIP